MPKTNYSYSTFNPISSIQTRHGRFGVDWSKAETDKKLTLMYYDESAKKLAAFAEVPVIKNRNEIIRIINLFTAYAKVCANFSAENPAKMVISHDAMVKLLTKNAASKTAEPEKAAPRRPRQALWDK